MKPNLTRFSETHGVTLTAHDDWFDPLLNEDTRLYVDPFLIFFDQNPQWANGHTRIMRFFDMVLQLLAESGFRQGSPQYQKAKSLLLFPEPPEFCLGTSDKSIFGAGTADGLQKGMLEGAATAIRGGIDDLAHFEEIALLGEQIGPDRIGDITCNVLKEEFVRYTQEIARRHGVPLHDVNLRTLGWDATRKMWRPGQTQLPLNPIASAQKGHPIGVMLTPKRFLRQLPTVDPTEFWDYAWSNESEQLRADFNYEVGQQVSRKTIAKLARQHRGLLTRYIRALEEQPKPAYDVDQDPKLVVFKDQFARDVASTMPGGAPASETELAEFVRRLITNFKFCVEERGGWQLLWVGDQPRTEPYAQVLFQASAVWACKDRDVDMSPETNAGRGAVDFKMSRGWSLRALLELKLAGSSSFKRNLRNQEAIYAAAEGCDIAYFGVVQYRDSQCTPEFVAAAEEIARSVAADKGIKYEVFFIDARPKPTASTV